MMALGCDEIVMGRHSELGPIDPQILIPVPEGVRYAPAIAILRDFERAKEEIAEQIALLPAWTPILRGYAGGLVEFCNQQIKLSQDIVAGWLRRYMFRNPRSGIQARYLASRARHIARHFGSPRSYDRFRTHGRPIRLEELQNLTGLVITPLEDDQALQDAVLSVYHAIDLTFSGPAIKVIENHNGAMYVRVAQTVSLQAERPTDGDEAGTASP